MKTLKGTKQKKLMVMKKNHVVWSCGLKTSVTNKRGCGLIVHVSHEIRVDFFLYDGKSMFGYNKGEVNGKS